MVVKYCKQSRTCFLLLIIALTRYEGDDVCQESIVGLAVERTGISLLLSVEGWKSVLLRMFMFQSVCFLLSVLMILAMLWWFDYKCDRHIIIATSHVTHPVQWTTQE